MSAIVRATRTMWPRARAETSNDFCARTNNASAAGSISQEVEDIPSGSLALQSIGSGTADRADALHVAVVQEHGVERILSFDARFDRMPGVRRLRD